MNDQTQTSLTDFVCTYEYCIPNNTKFRAAVGQAGYCMDYYNSLLDLNIKSIKNKDVITLGKTPTQVV